MTPIGTVSFSIYFHVDPALLAACGTGHVLAQARGQASSTATSTRAASCGAPAASCWRPRTRWFTSRSEARHVLLPPSSSAPVTPPAAPSPAPLREGYATCVTRRHADKLAPLVAQIEAAGGTAHASAAMPARKTRWWRWSSASSARSARSRCWCSTSAPTCPRASDWRPRAFSRWRWPAAGLPERASRQAHGGALHARRWAPRHHRVHRGHGPAQRRRPVRGVFRRFAMALRALAQAWRASWGRRAST